MSKSRSSRSNKAGSSGRSQRPPGLTLSGIAAGILLLIAVILQAAGVDLLGTGGSPTPTGEVVAGTPAGTPIAEVVPSFNVVFSAPTGSTDPTTYVNGPDTVLAAAIDRATQTVDVAAFELNSPAIAGALLNAHWRGVAVRLVVDDQHGLDVEAYQAYLEADEDEREDIADEMETPPDETLLDDLFDAGIPIVDDDDRDFMHNKFVIIDHTTVWTGTMNLTINGSYRNNNSLISVRSQRMVADYEAEFNEMFVDQQFGPQSPANTPFPQMVIDGVPVEVYFAPEDNVVPQIVAEIQAARSTIRFMAFSFTLDELGQAMLARAAEGVQVQGIFDQLNSGGFRFNQIVPLFCNGQDVRWDGNPFILHHKVILIDDSTVLVGSFNFSQSATNDNDENLVIIHDPRIAARFVAEFNARFAEASVPNNIPCG